VNATGTISTCNQITQRNLVLVGRALVFLCDVSAMTGPRLHWSERQALLCDARSAFVFGGIIASEWRARLWCAYHGFGFIECAVIPKPAAFSQWRYARRVRPAQEFRVDRYPEHQQRCPDCQRAFLRPRGSS